MGNRSKDRSFHLVHWLSVILLLQRTSQESIHLESLARIIQLPSSVRNCRCPFDSHGHHRAVCATVGVLGRRGFAPESAAARYCREAGARVSLNEDGLLWPVPFWPILLWPVLLWPKSVKFYFGQFYFGQFHFGQRFLSCLFFPVLRLLFFFFFFFFLFLFPLVCSSCPLNPKP